MPLLDLSKLRFDLYLSLAHSFLIGFSLLISQHPIQERFEHGMPNSTSRFTELTFRLDWTGCTHLVMSLIDNALAMVIIGPETQDLTLGTDVHILF